MRVTWRNPQPAVEKEMNPFKKVDNPFRQA